MFRNATPRHPIDVSLWSTVLVILLSEHLFFAAQGVYRAVLDRVVSDGDLRLERERFLVRKAYLNKLGIDKRIMESNLSSLKQEVGEGNTGIFWRHQRNAEEVVQAGLNIMRGSMREGKKSE